MMKHAAAIVLLLTLTGCATRHVDENEAPSLVPPADVPAASANPASDARLAEMQTSMTELLERMDVLNARIARLESASQGEPRVAQAPAQRAIEPPPSQRVTEPPPATAAASVPARKVPPASSPLQSAAIADNYRSALILFGKGRMAEARTVLQQVFDADPSGDLADNALYWIGETYYAAADYSKAMRAYERVTKEYPEQNKAPDAMFKIGLTFVKTGDLGMARKTFEEVIRRYPYSTAASSAKLELKRVKY
ncbi:MAG TPA: tol-pal system protein YbgF [Thermoanaerobaculia bacterium]|jgi:tol-pal system protein YbgF|nr:tol-pal system protein YbgF [Thermoanaerobaculia bacterium]